MDYVERFKYDGYCVIPNVISESESHKYIDIVKSDTDTRFIIRSIDSLEKIFVKNNYKFNIYTNIKNMNELKDNIFAEKESGNYDNFIDVFITVDQKLVNFDFNKYSIKSYKKLDDLNKSKILDYSLEIS